MNNRDRKRNTKDQDKTKTQLINELVAFRYVIANLEKLEAERRRTVLAIREAYEYVKNIVDTVREPLLVLDGKLRVASANHSFCQTFQVTPEEIEGQLFFSLVNRQFNIAKLRKLLKDILVNNTTFDDFEMERDFPTIGHRVMLLNARRIYREANKARLILLAIEDITERKLVEQAVQGAREYVVNRVKPLREPLVVLDANLQVVG